MNRRPARGQRGIAVLAATLVLLIAMTMTAAFVNRSLTFVMRSAANQTRAMQSLASAEAGLEWASALLNDPGPIDDACTPGALGLSFRQRFLKPDAAGSYAPDGADAPGCLIASSALACSCAVGPAMPSTFGAVGGSPGGSSGGAPVGAPVGALGGTGAGSGMAASAMPSMRFSLRFTAIAGDPQSVLITSQGCTRLGAACSVDLAAQSLEAAAVATATFTWRAPLPSSSSSPTSLTSTEAAGVMVRQAGSWHDF